ncbi:MAG: hypothetical protein AB8H79_26920 [Myxococcota bacterium]
MKVRVALIGAALLIACKPPPEVQLGGTDSPADESPQIRIIYPPQSRDGGGGPFELASETPGGDWLLTIAFDIDDLELVDPYSDPDPPIVEGEGHWHLDSDNSQFGTVVDFVRFAEVPILRGDAGVQENVIITVTLRDNDHGALPSINGSNVEDTVEIKLVDP